MKRQCGRCRMRTRLAVAAGAILFFATGAFAHHRVEVQYNPNMPIQLRGTLTRVAWDNPHVRFYLDVKDHDGSLMKWTLEMGSPNQQFLRGWKIDTFRRGDRILVEAYPARDGSNLGYAKSVSKSGP